MPCRPGTAQPRAPWRPNAACPPSTHLTSPTPTTKHPTHPLQRVELQQDRKWVVEHHIANREIVVEATDPKHVVYIYNCHNSVIQV